MYSGIFGIELTFMGPSSMVVKLSYQQDNFSLEVARSQDAALTSAAKTVLSTRQSWIRTGFVPGSFLSIRAVDYVRVHNPPMLENSDLKRIDQPTPANGGDEDAAISNIKQQLIELLNGN